MKSILSLDGIKIQSIKIHSIIGTVLLLSTQSKTTLRVSSDIIQSQKCSHSEQGLSSGKVVQWYPNLTLRDWKSVFVHLSICLSVCLSVGLSICLWMRTFPLTADIIQDFPSRKRQHFLRDFLGQTVPRLIASQRK